MATIEQILRMSVAERKKYYGTDNMHIVKIDNQDFTNYGDFSFLLKKSYKSEPKRASDGTIGNLNSQATFVIPHLIINFSLMSLDDYRRLMRLIYEKNEFTVNCYDIVSQARVTHKMYFAPDEMPKLYTVARAFNGEEWTEVLGVQDYTVEMIGTKSPLSKINVLYYDENGVLIPDSSQEVDVGTEVLIDLNYIPTNPSVRFDGFWKRNNSDTEIIGNGTVLKVPPTYEDIKLYAKTEPTDEYTLTFDYGVGIPLQQTVDGVLNSIKIKRGQKISEAINNANITLYDGTKLTFDKFINGTEKPKVEYNGKKYEPYTFHGWYWLATPHQDVRIDENTIFDYSINRTMYQIMDTQSYNVIYSSNVEQIRIKAAVIKYLATVPLPELAIEGKTFEGWYLGEERFNGIMPPTTIRIEAKWS